MTILNAVNKSSPDQELVRSVMQNPAQLLEVGTSCGMLLQDLEKRNSLAGLSLLTISIPMQQRVRSASAHLFARVQMPNLFHESCSIDPVKWCRRGQVSNIPPKTGGQIGALNEASVIYFELLRLMYGNLLS